jgi:hypothetical protein
VSLKLFVFLLPFTLISAVEAAIEVPDQFSSSNAAVILGLENETSVTTLTVKRAAQRLYSKFHPDRFMDESKFSAADRDAVTAIAAKIQQARQTLEDYIEFDPTYNPKEELASGGNSSRRSSEGNGRPYSWRDIFDEKPSANSQAANRSGSDVVNADHFGSSLRGTWFEFLYRHPGFQRAVIPMNGRSTSIDAVDIVMIIRPEMFPRIEIRYLSRPGHGQSPQLVESVYATYVRGHYSTFAGKRFDAIVLPDGRYLMNALESGRPRTPFVASPFGDTAGNFIVNSTMDFFLTEIESNGISNRTNYTMVQKDPLLFLPAEKPIDVPKWKKLELPMNSNVIQLGYTPESPTLPVKAKRRTCRSLFR